MRLLEWALIQSDTNTPGMYTHKVLREGSHLQDRGRDFQKSQNKSSADALETSVQDRQTQRENASLLRHPACGICYGSLG